MPNLENQKILRITDKNKPEKAPDFITEDVIEVKRAKMVYYKWISRLMTALCVVSLSYGICATLVILVLVPRILVDAQIFVEFSDSQSLVKREYINAHMDSREQMMINSMKQYVELRNTFIRDELEMKKRWMWGGLVSFLSTKSVYKKFQKEYPKIQKELTSTKTSRSVEILSVERSGGENSYVWKVEFKTYDFKYNLEDSNITTDENLGPQIKERFWTANITTRAFPDRRIAYKRLLNPLGFTVLNYYQSEIEN